ncbi:MAG: biosynthetic-type acetolactate synthase large subunit [Cyclobacteriaceae bacterium]|nr:biosynthetic-type acetolactate synthase large subunit [Cyclobacteriaceae bacterium]MDH4296664.1 biosynthetic-type acetolactate synthase large subunit [Cyclobacteriaceae bacterium]MDH5250687.1 biosynthetic-type acetolactate synthase large subunit [Cyclobacteriaceae bacterium]
MDVLLTKSKPTVDTEKSSNQPTNQISGSEVLLRCLVEEGVDTIFGYPGGAIMPVYDALYHYADKLTHILVRHEQGAIHAAQGFARVTGKAGVVFATSGPGATNLVTGLADALIDSTPVVCITGQVFAHLLGTDAFQETDVVNTTIPVTKWNIQVTEAKDIANAVAKAFYIANSGRPGPVLVDITKNAQNEMIAEADYHKCESIRTYKPTPVLQLSQVEAAAQLINNAKRPYILAGQGILLSGATEELKAFSEKTGIPVACTLLGLGGFPSDHPNYVGYLGMHGNYGPNLNTNECDVLIAIGMRFDDRVTGNVSKYAKQAKIIHIEIDKAEINKIVKTEVAVNADAKEALQILLEKCSKNRHQAWIDSFTRLNNIEYEKVIVKEFNPTGELTMGEVINHLSNFTKGEAIVITDVGQHQMVTSRYYKYKNPRTNVTSGGAGTMGFALPAAIGAKLGVPDKEVLAVIGDGGYQMTVQELGTIMQYQIPVKIVVLNNNFLGMVRQWQQLFHGKRYSFTEMQNPDFVKLAEAYGIPARKVEAREDLQGAIKEMLASKTPYFLEVVVGKEDNVFPMVPAGAGVSDVLLEEPKD